MAPDLSIPGGRGEQVMRLSSRIHEEKCSHPIPGHSCCSQSPFRQVPQGTVHPGLHFRCCTMAWATKLCPGALVNFTGLQTTHQLPDLADGVEGRAKMHVLSTAESCTEGGLEPQGCALKWRGECENMLCDCSQSAEISGKGGQQEMVVPSPGPRSTW